jgi:hypothetical protein
MHGFEIPVTVSEKRKPDTEHDVDPLPTYTHWGNGTSHELVRACNGPKLFSPSVRPGEISCVSTTPAILTGPASQVNSFPAAFSKDKEVQVY